MQSTLIEQDTSQTTTTKQTASEFFDSLINNYQPLLADAKDASTKDKSEVEQPKPTDKKDTTKKGIKNLVMGQLKDVSSIKLSDFIDEKFLEELDDADQSMQNDVKEKQLL